MLAVVMVDVGQHGERSLEYAHRLRSDLLKHLYVPHKVYCYTCKPASMYPRTRCKPHPIGVDWHNGCMFRAGAFREDRLLYLSSDIIITDDINCLAEYEGEFSTSQKAHIMM
jgi:hypothetical protein